MSSTDTPPVRIPRVARARKRKSLVPAGIGLALLGTGVFAKLVDARQDRAMAATALPPLRMAAVGAPANDPIPGQAVALVAAPLVTSQPSILPPTALPSPLSNPGQSSAFRPTVVAQAGKPVDAARNRGGGPTLIVDFAQTRSGGTPADATGGTATTLPTATVSDPTGDAIAAAGRAGAAAAGLPVATPDGLSDLGANERFAKRAGDKETEVSRASFIPARDRLVTQGTVIGAVMETALNSDLPGFARAVTTRDVLSFDGANVLIPAGSRIVGEYKSGVAQGAKRIFIIWNRLIRPDGVSINLASPAVDDLGRGGLDGKVNRHFLQRYGGAILLSVLTGGISAFVQSQARGSSVIVNSTNEATSLAGQASRGTDIAPTIKTRQGALVRIFVARDLDFSAVGPAS